MRKRRGRPSGKSKAVDPDIGRSIEITIDEIGSGGDGIGRFEGHPIFVPLTLPGDALTVRIRARRGAGYAADVLENLTLAERQPPVCAHFGACGGCRLQHLPAADYRRWKTRLIETALAKRGIDHVEIRPLIDAEPASRRRLRLAFEPKGESVVLGFRKRLGHEVEQIDECPIAHTDIVNLFKPLRQVLAALDMTAKGGEMSITAAANGLDLLIDTSIEPGLADRETLAAFADTHDLARLTWRPDTRTPPEPLSIRRQPMVDFGGVLAPLPPGAFLQATEPAERAIRDTVTQVLGDAGEIIDLFAGCGALSLPLAREGRHIRTFERDPTMVRALTTAAANADLADRVDAAVRDLDREPLTSAEIAEARALIVDPPRAGARLQIEAIAAASGPKTICMVSCNPRTFARDARALVDAGYRLLWLQPIDAFLYATEIELVAAFQRTITP